VAVKSGIGFKYQVSEHARAAANSSLFILHFLDSRYKFTNNFRNYQKILKNNLQKIKKLSRFIHFFL